MKQSEWIQNEIDNYYDEIDKIHTKIHKLYTQLGTAMTQEAYDTVQDRPPIRIGVYQPKGGLDNGN